MTSISITGLSRQLNVQQVVSCLDFDMILMLKMALVVGPHLVMRLTRESNVRHLRR